jgi:hypothetical protein
MATGEVRHGRRAGQGTITAHGGGDKTIVFKVQAKQYKRTIRHRRTLHASDYGDRLNENRWHKRTPTL